MKDQTELVIAENQNYYRTQISTTANSLYMAGAPSPALIYQNERFQFTYLHTPLLMNANGVSADSPYTEIGASNYVISVDANYRNFFSRYSGLYLIDLSVQSGVSDFWQILGFTQTSFVDDNCSNLNNFTTNCFIGESDYQNKTYSFPSVSVPGANAFNFFITSSNSTAVEAESNFQYDESGYYLINVISSFNNNYITQDSTLSKVACIASKQYQAGDYVSVYSDSSIPYQHRGEPIILTNFQVQIVEPKTKALANDLGSNSTIFLEVVKAQQQSIKAK